MVSNEAATGLLKKRNSTQGVDGAAIDYLKAFSTWDYIEQSMDRWVQLIRTRLDSSSGLNVLMRPTAAIVRIV
jgi:hypothetical protein